MWPRISVVITAYNKAPYLRQSVESVQQQTYPHVECIVIDDGSTDHTPEVMAAIAQDYPDVIYHRTANGGVSAARNLGWAKATGDWLQFLDADDWIHPDKLRSQFAAIPDPQADVVVYSDYERVYVDEQDQVIATKLHWVGECSPAQFIQRLLICPDFLADTPFPLLQQCLLFRRSRLDFQRFDPGLQACEDRALVLAWLQQGIPFIYVPMVGAYYRKHRQNLTDDGALMRRAYVGYLQRMQAAYPDLKPACQRSVRYLLEQALERQDRDQWQALLPLATYPVPLLGGRVRVPSPRWLAALWALRSLLPTVLLYPHRRGPRSQKLLAWSDRFCTPSPDAPTV